MGNIAALCHCFAFYFYGKGSITAAAGRRNRTQSCSAIVLSFLIFLFQKGSGAACSVFCQVNSFMQSGIEILCKIVGLKRGMHELRIVMKTWLIIRNRREAINRSCESGEVNNQEQYNFGSYAFHQKKLPSGDNPPSRHPPSSAHRICHFFKYLEFDIEPLFQLGSDFRAAAEFSCEKQLTLDKRPIFS